MRVINLFAGPGAGKSTTAAGLFHSMKLDKFNVELVTEYAKDLTWDERWGTLDDQLYVFAKQHNRLYRLRDKVDYVVTDSPLLVGLMYKKPNYLPLHFDKLVMEAWNTYENYNFFLHRRKEYVQVGRTQTLEQAQEVDTRVKNYLDMHGIAYETVPGDVTAVNTIRTWIDVYNK